MYVIGAIALTFGFIVGVLIFFFVPENCVMAKTYLLDKWNAFKNTFKS